MANSELGENIKSYRDLRVWRETMNFACDCHVLTRGFPREETYGTTTQIRRAAASIAANIAEGHGREARGSFAQFLRMSQGSFKELETQLLLAGRVAVVEAPTVEPILERCDVLGRMLRRLTRSLQERAIGPDEVKSDE